LYTTEDIVLVEYIGHNPVQIALRTGVIAEFEHRDLPGGSFLEDPRLAFGLKLRYPGASFYWVRPGYEQFMPQDAPPTARLEKLMKHTEPEQLLPPAEEASPSEEAALEAAEDAADLAAAVEVQEQLESGAETTMPLEEAKTQLDTPLSPMVLVITGMERIICASEELAYEQLSIFCQNRMLKQFGAGIVEFVAILPRLTLIDAFFGSCGERWAIRPLTIDVEDALDLNRELGE
jgi:hypothetical protein